MSVVPALQRPPADTRPSTRTDIIVFGVALAVRTLFVVLQHRSGPFLGGNLPSPDAKLYLDIADRLTAGAGFVTSGPVGWKESGYPFSLGPTMWVMPGYPMFLSACRLLFGSGILAVQLVQAVLGALACVATSRVAAQLAGRRAGWIAGIVSALYYELVFTTTAIGTEPLYTFVVACMLCAFVAAVNARDLRSAPFAAAGVLFGIATLIRPEAFGGAVCVAVAWMSVRTKDALIFLVAWPSYCRGASEIT